jgi:uncharacterized protein (DUF2336 family)
LDSAALIEQLNDAVARGTAGQRAEILHRITELFVASSASYSEDQIGFFDDILIQLSASIEQSARVALAKRLAPHPRAPLRISRTLASDDAIDVAAPVLEQSQRLDSATLLSAARNKSQRHLLALSKRNSLDESLTDVLVARGCQSVVLNMARNPGARFSDTGFTVLTAKSQDDDELAVSVGLRRDVPRQHLLHLLVRASHSVRQKLEAANPSMSVVIREAVSQAAHKVLAKNEAIVRDYTSACQRIEAMNAADQLTRNEVAAFAAAGQFEETVAALAVLCELPVEEVDRAMNQEQPDAVLIIAKAIGITSEAAGDILRMRAGARGISPGELEQCLATFARLRPTIARQVIKFRENQAGRFSRALTEA